MEELGCPLCRGRESRIRHREDGYTMVRCLHCGLFYLQPRPSPEALLAGYQHYLPESAQDIEAWRVMMAPVFSRGARLIEEAVPKGRLLDVGTGYGFFPALMQSRGWEVVGVEPNKKAAAFGRRRLGVEILAEPWELAARSFKDGQFDAVTAFYVIEHLPDPLGFLKEVHRVLRPRGVILARYPHTTPIKDILALIGIRNRLYQLPYHICDFSPTTMHKAMKEAGFCEVVTVVGGYTSPADVWGRWGGRIFGCLAEILYRLTSGRVLLPGVSKTTLARKGG